MPLAAPILEARERIVQDLHLPEAESGLSSDSRAKAGARRE
jgi:hypothetical protein